MNIGLGQRVRDVVTGFEGIATARIEYLNGCTQYAVTPPARDGKMEDPAWLDHQRLEAIGDVLVVPRSDTGGVMGDVPPASYRG